MVQGFIKREYNVVCSSLIIALIVIFDRYIISA